MFDIIMARLLQGKLTIPFPAKDPVLPDRYRGLPILDTKHCPPDCQLCMKACPVDAISFFAPEQPAETHQEVAIEKTSSKKKKHKKGVAAKKNEPAKITLASNVAKAHIDLGRCLFCNECQNACSRKYIEYTNQFRLATSKRKDLILGSDTGIRLAKPPSEEIRKLFNRSLKIRMVSAGDCNACSVDFNVLHTLAFDLGRFGIQAVASPRHADALLVTGPVSENMKEALLKTYDAIPSPKLVIAVGSCAISGGPFRNNPEVHNGLENLLPVDLFIPGCPPHPMTILDGLLRLIGRI